MYAVPPRDSAPTESSSPLNGQPATENGHSSGSMPKARGLRAQLALSTFEELERPVARLTIEQKTTYVDAIALLAADRTTSGRPIGTEKATGLVNSDRYQYENLRKSLVKGGVTELKYLPAGQERTHRILNACAFLRLHEEKIHNRDAIPPSSSSHGSPQPKATKAFQIWDNGRRIALSLRQMIASVDAVDLLITHSKCLEIEALNILGFSRDEIVERRQTMATEHYAPYGRARQSKVKDTRRDDAERVIRHFSGLSFDRAVSLLTPIETADLPVAPRAVSENAPIELWNEIDNPTLTSFQRLLFVDAVRVISKASGCYSHACAVALGCAEEKFDSRRQQALEPNISDVLEGPERTARIANAKTFLQLRLGCNSFDEAVALVKTKCTPKPQKVNIVVQQKVRPHSNGLSIRLSPDSVESQERQKRIEALAARAKDGRDLWVESDSRKDTDD